ncbi:SDR family oxidoreductase [Dermabacter sp. Marseille-Q3180]|uniref:SDR family NAD(P)-dependent oxidoreductase n=1 Tax=Dermabacter sp. Marseille-Q3180 TaxID=2758090 RepID=UPI0020247504|nr:SDR family oxidoreductase [Dermabacter sp. Marseille-Q3180]
MTEKSFPKTKTAIVTGAGAERGIGRRVAEQLAIEGWSIAALDIDENAVRGFAEDLSRRTEAKVLGFGTDVSCPDSVANTFEAIDRSELPDIYAVVNLAGIPSPLPFLEIDEAHWDKVMGVNAKGTLLVSQEAAKRMVAKGTPGRFVNTASITAFDGGGTFSKTGYAAAKAAIIGLTKGMARELGEYAITANVIAPGPIDTDIMGGRLTDERKNQMSSDMALKRVGQPEEIAALVSFLVSEDSGFITGETIRIDGGKHIF